MFRTISFFVVFAIFITNDCMSQENVYVATKDICKNEIITPNMIKSSNIANHNIDTNKNITDYNLQYNDLIGMASKNKILKGSIISKKNIKKSILIQKNQVIDVIYNSQEVKINTKGKSVEPGRYNDDIKIKMIDSGNIIIGKVMIDGTASIQ